MILNLSADRDERLVNQQRIILGRPQAGLLQKCQVRSGRSGRNSLRASNSLVAASAIADWVLLADFVVWMVRDRLFHAPLVVSSFGVEQRLVMVLSLAATDSGPLYINVFY